MNEFQIDQLIEASNLTLYITALFNLMSIYSLLLEENNVQSLDLCILFDSVLLFDLIRIINRRMASSTTSV